MEKTILCFRSRRIKYISILNRIAILTCVRMASHQFYYIISCWWFRCVVAVEIDFFPSRDHMQWLLNWTKSNWTDQCCSTVNIAHSLFIAERWKERAPCTTLFARVDKRRRRFLCRTTILVDVYIWRSISFIPAYLYTFCLDLVSDYSRLMNKANELIARFLREMKGGCRIIWIWFEEARKKANSRFSGKNCDSVIEFFRGCAIFEGKILLFQQIIVIFQSKWWRILSIRSSILSSIISILRYDYAKFIASYCMSFDQSLEFNDRIELNQTRRLARSDF